MRDNDTSPSIETTSQIAALPIYLAEIVAALLSPEGITEDDRKLYLDTLRHVAKGFPDMMRAQGQNESRVTEMMQVYRNLFPDTVTDTD